jgi:hypothetical protein
MSPHLRIVAWAAASSSAVLAAGLFLPLWERVASVQHVPSAGGNLITMETVSVWRMLSDPRPPSQYELDNTREANRTTFLGVLAAAGIVGALVYWVRRPGARPLEAGDYSDGPGGSFVDGRA